MNRSDTKDSPKTCRVEPIGRVISPFRQKFGIPRQAGLVREAVGWIELLPPYADPQMVAGIEGFSHLWVIYQFHRCVPHGWRRRVRPPRLGGNRSRGVLASRSPFRPNHLGLSVLELLGVERKPPRLRVRGLDVLDGSPVFDIKPYLPYSDAIPAARGGFAGVAPERTLSVRFAPEAEASLAARPPLRALIQAVLELDPRPAYHARGSANRDYGMQLGDVEVKFSVDRACALVTAIVPLPGD